jgi:hypothetical protein
MAKRHVVAVAATPGAWSQAGRSAEPYAGGGTALSGRAHDSAAFPVVGERGSPLNGHDIAND